MVASSPAYQTLQCSNLNREKERPTNIFFTTTIAGQNKQRLRRVARSPAVFFPRECHNRTQWILFKPLTARFHGFGESKPQLEGHSYTRKTPRLTEALETFTVGETGNYPVYTSNLIFDIVFSFKTLRLNRPEWTSALSFMFHQLSFKQQSVPCVLLLLR